MRDQINNEGVDMTLASEPPVVFCIPVKLNANLLRYHKGLQTIYGMIGVEVMAVANNASTDVCIWR